MVRGDGGLDVSGRSGGRSRSDRGAGWCAGFRRRRGELLDVWTLRFDGRVVGGRQHDYAAVGSGIGDLTPVRDDGRRGRGQPTHDAVFDFPLLGLDDILPRR